MAPDEGIRNAYSSPQQSVTVDDRATLLVPLQNRMSHKPSVEAMYRLHIRYIPFPAR